MAGISDAQFAQCVELRLITGLRIDAARDLLVSSNWQLAACVSKYFDAVDSGVGDDSMDGASAGGASSGGPAVGRTGDSQVSMPVVDCSRTLCNPWRFALICVGVKYLVAVPLSGIWLPCLLS